jgi:glycosyltransferase involved in cell wall biosynthesis
VSQIPVSIVIPARNESEDIANTLEACLEIEYEPKEIIVVDDSTDNTPEIVRRYAPQGVRLIHRDKNQNGCCGARNVGMQHACGQIVVLLNADAMPQKDYLTRLMPHYQNGADFVIVQSTVKNINNIWNMPMLARSLKSPYSDPLWSEGFSVRLSAAKAVDYIPGDFPVSFCRDYMLGARLTSAGFVKHIDREIKMEHIWPDRLSTFWANQIHRGTHAAPTFYYFKRRSLVLMVLREFLKLLRTLGLYLLIFPKIMSAVHLSKYIDPQRRSVLIFFLVECVADLATVLGNLKGAVRVLRTEISLNRLAR